MKPALIALGLSLFVGLASAQDTQPLSSAPVSYIVPSVWRVTFLDLGLHNEAKLGVRTTLASGISFTVNGNAESIVTAPGTTSVVSSLGLAPYVYTGVRYFYNFERRLEKQKSIRYNSGNYLSLRARYITPTIWKREDVLAPLPRIDGVYLDALWGFQRTYRRNFYLNLSLGLGVGRRGITGATDFLLGYTFPNRRANP